MTSSTNFSTSPKRHHGPPLGIVAVVYMLIFLVGLYFVSPLRGKPFFPAPSESFEVIAAFFAARSSAVLFCAALHFGAAIPLGIYTATIVSRLRFLGVRAAGAYITLFGGFATAVIMVTSSSVLWTMSYPGIAQDSTLLQALYRLQFALGGPGFSVPFGLLAAGVSVTAGFTKLLPKWLVVFGLLIAIAGELSWLNLLSSRALVLIPLTRFPGFIWLIVVGFILPNTAQYRANIIDHKESPQE
jgi:hypothetical protein